MTNPEYVTDLDTMTFEHYVKREAQSNIEKNSVIFSTMKNKGMYKSAPGGLKLVAPIRYKRVPNVGAYNGVEDLRYGMENMHTNFEQHWKFYAGAYVLTGYDQVVNAGTAEQIIDMKAERMNAVTEDLGDVIDGHGVNDGTGDNGMAYQGLKYHITQTPTTGTVGGIDRSANAYARNRYYHGPTDFSGPIGVGNIKEAINHILVDNVIGSSRLDLCFSGRTHYLALLGALQSHQFTTDKDQMSSITYGGTTFINCAGLLNEYGSISADESYFLSSKNYCLKYREGRNFVYKGGNRAPVSQDAQVRFMFWCGNTIVNDYRILTILKG